MYLTFVILTTFINCTNAFFLCWILNRHLKMQRLLREIGALQRKSNDEILSLGKRNMRDITADIALLKDRLPKKKLSKKD